jgi:CubicO group peptidase (beta-lactamase class C family)
MTHGNVDISSIVESARRSWSIPGVSVAVVRADAPHAPVTLGYADLGSRAEISDATVFQIGSISKSFTGIFFAHLANDHRVDLGDPVTKYLPWFRVDSRWSSITLRSLLHHTAGLITCMDSIPDAEAQAAATRFTEAGCAPGEWFHYSNVGYAILGLVAKAITGDPIGECVQRAILDPLGMDRSFSEMTHEMHSSLATGYVPVFDDRPFLPGDDLMPAPWFEFADASGNIAATARDMGAYAQMLLGRGSYEGRQIIAEAAFEQVVTDLGVAGAEARPGRYGLGLNVAEDGDGPVVSHGGGMVGYSSHLIAHLGLDVGVVVLTNAPGESGAAEVVARNVLAAIKSGSVEEHAVPDRRMIESPERYLGGFSDGSRSIRVSRADGGRGLSLESNEATGNLYETGYGWLACDHPELREGQHRIGTVDGVRCWTYGPHTLTDEDSTTVSADSAQKGHPLAGNYRSYTPWFPSFRIVQRGSELVLFASAGVESPMDEEVLVPIGDGIYRVGADPRLPERLVVGPMVDDEIVWVERNLCRYTRSFRD